MHMRLTMLNCTRRNYRSNVQVGILVVVCILMFIIIYMCCTNNFKTYNKPEISTNWLKRDHPGLYVSPYRFDVLIKTVYAYFYIHYERIPYIVSRAYIEHLRIWNNFKEYCYHIDSQWYDASINCQDKANISDFIKSFHDTIDSMRQDGFIYGKSRIPVQYDSGLLLNGAHRIASAIASRKTVMIEYVVDKYRSVEWDYNYFITRKFPTHLQHTIVYYWMYIQWKLKLPIKISIVCIFEDDIDNYENTKRYIKSHCAKDKQIIYEHSISLTKEGMKVFLLHIYGYQQWLNLKQQEMMHKFKTNLKTVRFIFALGNDWKNCKYNLRAMYNSSPFKSSLHIPDTSFENKILAEMILNDNSVLYMNFGETSSLCANISRTIATVYDISYQEGMPGIYPIYNDIMVDSGMAMSLMNIRKGTDIDMLFLNKTYHTLIGKHENWSFEPHHWSSWGRFHLVAGVFKEDIFFDMANFGNCFGLKFVSESQLLKYKIMRNEPQKDIVDVQHILKIQNERHKRFL